MLRHLLGDWLRNTARRRIRQEVIHTARGKIAPTEQPGQMPPDEGPCAVGFVFALGIEAGGLVDLLEDRTSARVRSGLVRQGRLGGRRVVLVESDAGAQRAAAAAETLLVGHRPEWIASAGFAGGLAPEVKRHDIVLANAVAAPDGRRLSIDLRAEPGSLGPGVHVGRILSTDEIVRQPADKRELGRRHEALAVDLESLAVAEVCRDRRVRFLAVRVVTDTVDEQLPADVQRLTDQPSTAARLGAALGAVWRRPGSIKDLYALRENALVASDRLARFLAGMIETLYFTAGVCVLEVWSWTILRGFVV
ncbi:MAG: hypothetical protein JW809_02410 [Pirellulales bacterium]|nr:hypothetical protein [Pirellulales bacterium]